MLAEKTLPFFHSEKFSRPDFPYVPVIEADTNTIKLFNDPVKALYYANDFAKRIKKKVGLELRVVLRTIFVEHDIEKVSVKEFVEYASDSQNGPRNLLRGVDKEYLQLVIEEAGETPVEPKPKTRRLVIRRREKE